jgi:hypothetical protein
MSYENFPGSLIEILIFLVLSLFSNVIFFLFFIRQGVIIQHYTG